MFCTPILSIHHECNGRVPAKGSARHLVRTPGVCAARTGTSWTRAGKRLGKTCCTEVWAVCSTGHQLAASLTRSQRLFPPGPAAFRSTLLLRAPLSLLQRLSLRQQHCNGLREGLPEAPRVWRHGRMQSRNVLHRLVPLAVCLVGTSLNFAFVHCLAAPCDVARMQTFHGKDADEQECHPALPPTIAKLLRDLMSCDPPGVCAACTRTSWTRASKRLGKM